MNFKLLKLTIGLCIFTLISCGGTVGNIKIYHFYSSSSKSLMDCINSVDDLVQLPTDTLYGKDILKIDSINNSYYFETVKYYINKESDTICVAFHIKSINKINEESHLVLTHYGKYRATLNFETDLSWREKRQLLSFWEEKVLPKLEKCAGKYGSYH